MNPLRTGAAAWLAAALALSLLLGACHDRSKAKEPLDKADPAWSEHLSEHSAGTVSRQQAIRLRFAHDIVGANGVGGSAADWLSIEPAIEGTPRFAGTRDIVWEHPAPLKRDQEYRARLSARGLLGVPQDLKPYEFSFRALPPDFEIKEAGLVGDRAVAGELSLRGQLETADSEDNSVVEKLLQARFGEQPLALEWVHVDGGRLHHFSAKGIARGGDTGLVRLSWNGAPLGANREGTRDLEVPALGVFGVLDAATLSDGRQTLRLRFTEPVDKKQKLDGLVTLSSGDYTTQVEGSELFVYPAEHIAGEVKVGLGENLRSSRGTKLGKAWETTLAFANERPQVRFAGKGSILPAGPALSIPIEVLNARAVRVTAFQIYESDVGQFLQVNPLDGENELYRVGRYLWRKTIVLPPSQPDRWNRQLLDAGELLRSQPGALYRLSLQITRADSSFDCPGAPPAPDHEPPLQSYEDNGVNDYGYDGDEGYYESEALDWNERDDPCKPSYFQWNPGVKAERNFLASNIGLIAKRGADDQLHVAATAIDSSQPLAGVKLTVRNYQQQTIFEGETGSDGLATLAIDGKRGAPFLLVAKRDRDVGYLKLGEGNALATSHFDTGGETVEGGLKGFLWGERGVWRPGDEIFLSFLLQDDSGRLPADHPVTLQLYNPQNQLVQTLTSKTPVDRFYSFKLRTAEDAPTGIWRAKALVGGREFAKNLRIETVMPNRLKAELGFAGPLKQEAMPMPTTLDAAWLHGAPAAGLKADVSVRLRAAPVSFAGPLRDFVFDDPTRPYQGEPKTVFEDRLDDQGKAAFSLELQPGSPPPARLEAEFTTRVFEAGGAFSILYSSQPYQPYPRYVGLKLPDDNRRQGLLTIDKAQAVSLALVDTDGKPAGAETLHVSLYKIDWRWWWDRDARGGLADFEQSSHNLLVQQDSVTLGADGRGEWSFTIKAPNWGRYLLRACDTEGGHCSAQVFYADWPGWTGRSQDQTGPGASALYFFADKASYTVGETAVVQLPDASVGRALLSIETGSKLLEKRWVELTPGKTRLEIPITAGMAPNAYLSLTLIQPHQSLTGKDNDRPIRLYGVIPVLAVDPATVLKPVIEAPEIWRPDGTVALTVKEAQGQEMTYSVAVVDEGLLGLTSYRTPNPHDHFYQREALGVRSWDLYDDVAGAYGGELERLLSLGGDEGKPNAEKQEQRRFPPVVRVLGPFRLAAGAFARHELALPQYIGAVRIMVVAARGRAYGAAEKTVIVREPMSVLATAPRLAGPGEETLVPVTAFAFEPNVKEVKLSLQADPKLFETVGAASQTLKFDKPGERSTNFAIRVKPGIGIGRLTVLAESGPQRSKTVIDLPVLARNPAIVREETVVLEPGEEWKTPIKPVGVAGTNAANLSLSTVPPIGLERRLDMLVRYPHGCVEQLTSAAFPQLFLDRLVPLDAQRKEEVQFNIKAAIERLRGYLSPNGSFRYWPSGSYYNSWADNYAGHFLAEAKLRGYHVPAEIWDAWLARQRRAAAEGVSGEDRGSSAYRLYTLALADKPDVGAMNRLAEDKSLDVVARWQLASAYALVGLPKAAQELLARTGEPTPDGRPGYSFRSELRDRAILLDLLDRLGDGKRAELEAQKVAADLRADQWLSTQSAAWGLLALARHYGSATPGGDEARPGFSYQLGEGAKARSGGSDRPMLTVAIPELAEGGALRLKNTSPQRLTASLTQRGSPAAGEERAAAQGLDLLIEYRGLKGEAIDESQLPQGRDFLARVTVVNRSVETLDDLALTQVFASGWQVHNPRFAAGDSTPAALDYQDIRDDRVLSYFALRPGESRRFEVLLNASYRGRYYLPASSVEAMYDARYNAHSAGRWVEVIAP